MKVTQEMIDAFNGALGDSDEHPDRVRAGLQAVLDMLVGTFVQVDGEFVDMIVQRRVFAPALAHSLRNGQQWSFDINAHPIPAVQREVKQA